MTWDDFDEESEDLDTADVLQRATASSKLRFVLEASRPPNWWGTGIPPEHLIAMAHDEGIPVSWVPSADILRALVATSTREERLALLVNRFEEVLSNCLEIAGECTDPWIEDERTLVELAIRAAQSGHHEAGMALAVSVGEPLAVWASTPRVKAFMSNEERDEWERTRKKIKKYAWASHEINSLPAAVHRSDVLRRALIAPIVGFFKPFRVEKGDPLPAGLSRHVVAHRATHEHFGKSNSLLAIMLATSIAREMQSWSEEVRMMDDPGV